ncbi:hypothetical protein ACU635_50435 [[Actinomadura] parvosata]|uniref:hypothetical protein n=1 Tax=[Actinomadura] parvosata TaxID=1955412 RepID=UPI00406C1087
MNPEREIERLTVLVMDTAHLPAKQSASQVAYAEAALLDLLAISGHRPVTIDDLAAAIETYARRVAEKAQSMQKPRKPRSLVLGRRRRNASGRRSLARAQMNAGRGRAARTAAATASSSSLGASSRPTASCTSS